MAAALLANAGTANPLNLLMLVNPLDGTTTSNNMICGINKKEKQMRWRIKKYHKWFAWHTVVCNDTGERVWFVWCWYERGRYGRTHYWKKPSEV